MPAWREAAISGRISMPKFVDVDWRVDLQTASDSTAQLAVPTAIVALQVRPLWQA